MVHRAVVEPWYGMMNYHGVGDLNGREVKEACYLRQQVEYYNEYLIFDELCDSSIAWSVVLQQQRRCN